VSGTDQLRPGGSSLSSVPLREGVVAGILAFALGVVLTLGLVVGAGVLSGTTVDERYDELDETYGEEPPSLPTAAGWLFFSAQFVDIEVDGGEDSLDTGSLDLLAELDAEGALPLSPVVWRLVPIVLLTVAGFALATLTTPADASARQGGTHGATLAVGYVVAALAGALLLGASVGDTTLSPAVGQAVVVAGVGYPLACGTLGGVLAAVLDR
jgi:hypothetical protein